MFVKWKENEISKDISNSGVVHSFIETFKKTSLNMTQKESTISKIIYTKPKAFCSFLILWYYNMALSFYMGEIS